MHRHGYETFRFRHADMRTCLTNNAKSEPLESGDGVDAGDVSRKPHA